MENNSGKFCVYCGGKLPEPEQMIINNNDNREIHYHTTIIQQAPTALIQPLTPAPRPAPKKEKAKPHILEKAERKPQLNLPIAIIGMILTLTAVIASLATGLYVILAAIVR